MLTSSRRAWPGLSTEHAWLPSHDRPTTTRPRQIGVAFSGHRALVYETHGRTTRADHAPGAAIVSGAEPVTWLRVREPVEALEMYPDPALLAATASVRASGPVEVAPRIGVPDGTVLAIGTLMRGGHVTGLTDVAASTLAYRLVDHLLDRYAGLPEPDRRVRAGRLDAAAVDRVADLVDARIGEALSLTDLAAAVRLSPFHFHRSFRATTGLAPHAFVTARRMDRARLLLATTTRTVEGIAPSVGFTNVSHFRRLFRRHHGFAPSDLRPRGRSGGRSGGGPGEGAGGSAQDRT